MHCDSSTSGVCVMPVALLSAATSPSSCFSALTPSLCFVVLHNCQAHGLAQQIALRQDERRQIFWQLQGQFGLHLSAAMPGS